MPLAIHNSRKRLAERGEEMEKSQKQNIHYLALSLWNYNKAAVMNYGWMKHDMS